MDSQVSIPKIPGCLTSENKETGSPNYVITFCSYTVASVFCVMEIHVWFTQILTDLMDLPARGKVSEESFLVSVQK